MIKWPDFNMAQEAAEEQLTNRLRLDEKAFYGIAGEFVRTIAPHTEADEAALLINYLGCFGSVIGRNAFFKVEGAKHFTNLYFVLVGPTSKARKGTAWNRTLEVFALVDPEWAKERVNKGLSTGEGLIRAVCGVEGSAPQDSRLMVFAPEFASALAVMQRQGNTLSASVREAWDSGSLQTMTKSEPLRADGAHISIAGHTTKEELCRNLTATETANGFANRFLLIRSQRSKFLPFGGSLSESEIKHLADQLRPSVAFSSRGIELVRDADTNALWAGVYPMLSEGQHGLVGAVTSRAEAQVLRLSCIYALLDGSSVIRVPHLEAALAIWDYSAASVDWIFGEALGDPVADAILSALRNTPSGMTRTEISAALGRNQTASRINSALQSLRSSGLARAEFRPANGSGKSPEAWYADVRGTN